MEKIDISIVPSESGGTYPRPFDEPSQVSLSRFYQY